MPVRRAHRISGRAGHRPDQSRPCPARALCSCRPPPGGGPGASCRGQGAEGPKDRKAGPMTTPYPAGAGVRRVRRWECRTPPWPQPKGCEAFTTLPGQGPRSLGLDRTRGLPCPVRRQAGCGSAGAFMDRRSLPAGGGVGRTGACGQVGAGERGRCIDLMTVPQSGGRERVCPGDRSSGPPVLGLQGGRYQHRGPGPGGGGRLRRSAASSSARTRLSLNSLIGRPRVAAHRTTLTGLQQGTNSGEYELTAVATRVESRECRRGRGRRGTPSVPTA